jgi:hypothetical protein
VLLEDDVDGLEVELLGQVGDRQVLVVELAVDGGVIVIAAHQVAEVLPVRFAVTLAVHAHEAEQLDEAGVHAPARAPVGRRHGVDHVALEPAERTRLGQLIGDGRGEPGVDGRAHEGHGGGARLLAVLGHQGGGGQHRRARLADGDHVGAGTDFSQHVADVVDVVVEVEAAVEDRRLASIDPVGDEHLVVLQERLDGAAQQGGVVPAHGRDEQQRRLKPALARLAQVAIVAGEMQQAHPRRAPDLDDADADLDAPDLDVIDVPLGLAVPAREILEQIRARRQRPPELRTGGRVQR